jgi:hypothetical protein
VNVWIGKVTCDSNVCTAPTSLQNPQPDLSIFAISLEVRKSPCSVQDCRDIVTMMKDLHAMSWNTFFFSAEVYASPSTSEEPSGHKLSCSAGHLSQSLLSFHDFHASILSGRFNNWFFVSVGTDITRATTVRLIGGAHVSASKMFFTPGLPNPCRGQRVACETAVFCPRSRLTWGSSSCNPFPTKNEIGL